MSWQVREAQVRRQQEVAAREEQVRLQREAEAREEQARRQREAEAREAVLSLSDDGSASLTLPAVSTASTPLDGDDASARLVVDIADDDIDGALPEDAALPEDGAVLEDAAGGADADDADVGDELGDELDAELEAEAAEMAPLVELPDRASFSTDGHHAPEPQVATQPTATGELLTVRVRGHGRVPARKVRRVIRRVDPLSVLKLSFAFSLCLFAMFLVAAVLLWSAAVGAGSTDNIQSFVRDIGFEDFRLVGRDLFRGFIVFGGALVVAGTVFSVLLALLFNLISDIVGGIRFTVIEPLLPEPAVAAEPTEPAEA